MSELDDKLNETFKLVIAGHLSIRDAIGISKQAFTDAGYEPVYILNRQESYDATKNPIYKTPTLMTGQEWYDRFDKKLKGIALPYETQSHDAQMAFNLCTEAAKRAAGLTE